MVYLNFFFSVIESAFKLYRAGTAPPTVRRFLQMSLNNALGPSNPHSLLRVCEITNNSMAPSFSFAVERSVDKVVSIVFPAGDGTVFPGDYVMCVIPEEPAKLSTLLVTSTKAQENSDLFPKSTVDKFNDHHSVLTSALVLKRVAAISGDEIVEKAVEDKEKSFKLPTGTCWVLNENLEADLDEFPDSRRFGPLPYGFIISRALYHIQDSGYKLVNNSREASKVDEIIDRGADTDLVTMRRFVDKWLTEYKEIQTSKSIKQSSSSVKTPT